jgi:hypothetical protein
MEDDRTVQQAYQDELALENKLWYKLEELLEQRVQEDASRYSDIYVRLSSLKRLRCDSLKKHMAMIAHPDVADIHREQWEASDQASRR